ncbi:MAG: hypothetical protein ABUL44_00405 [Flavobacterium sp.]
MFKLLTFVSILFFSTLHAQNNWKKITITVNGDSLNGEIAIRIKFKSFKSLAVRNKETGITTVYKPKEIRSFTIKVEEQDLYFKTLQLEADHSSTDLSMLEQTPIVTLVKDTVFAQLLEEGEKKLYSYKDDKAYKKHYVIETTDGQAIDLINKQYYLNKEKTVSVCNEEYKKQLNELLKSYTAEINATSFTEKEIKKLIKDYNNTSDKKNTYEYKEEKVKLCIGLIAGGHSTSLKFGGANNELLYSNYKFQSENFYSYDDAKKSYDIVNASISGSYLKLFNALRFQMCASHFNPFIQVGIANGFALEGEANKYYPNAVTGLTKRTVPIVPYRKYEQSVFAGVGARYKKIALELRYEIGNGISNDMLIGSITKSAYVLLSYAFKG